MRIAICSVQYCLLLAAGCGLHYLLTKRFFLFELFSTPIQKQPEILNIYTLLCMNCPRGGILIIIYRVNI